MDLMPGDVAFKQRISLSLDRINFLPIGAQVRSCELAGRLALCSAKCILPVVLYRAFKYHQNQCSNCGKESRERGVDCMNQAHRTRNSSFYVKVNVLPYSPREGSSRHFGQAAHEVGKIVSSTHQPPLPLGEIRCYLFR